MVFLGIFERCFGVRSGDGGFFGHSVCRGLTAFDLRGEFFQQTADVFRRVLAFLGLQHWEPTQYGNRFPGKYTDTMRQATRRRLVEYFAPHNEQLYAHLGVRFDWDR